MNRCESINSMELNETKRTFSLSSIHKNFQIYKNVLKMAATFILLSLISATLGISLNMIHPKDSTIQSLNTGNLHIRNNETLDTLQNNSMRPDLFVWSWHCCRKSMKSQSGRTRIIPTTGITVLMLWIKHENILCVPWSKNP